MSSMPVGFVSHGSPAWALEPQKLADWKAWAEAMPRPKAILVISAHWENSPPALGQIESPRLIYDFSGFPDSLSRLNYPAPGAPLLKNTVESLIQEHFAKPDFQANRGWDHGVWIPLLGMYPAADIPLLQLALPSVWSGEDLFALGRTLAPLREQGVLILGSGSLVHNLATMDFHHPQAPIASWAQDFEDWCLEVLETRDWEALANFPEAAPQADHAHPTYEHFLPLLVVAGAAQDASRLQVPVRGFEFGSLSRGCLQWD